MSFSNKVRKEAINKKISEKIEKVCQLCGIIGFAGMINFYGGGEIGLCLQTENPAIARKIFSLYKDIYGHKLKIRSKKTSPHRRSLYTLSTRGKQDLLEFMQDLGIIEKKQGKIEKTCQIPSFVSDTLENSKSYISGAYIVSASMSDPEKFYHVEFLCHSQRLLEDFSVLLDKFSIKSNLSKRKDSHLCYIKDSDSISNLLNILGAHQSMFDFEDIRIKKQMRNDVNRLVNCETSNLDRVVKAAVRQVESIKYIENTKGLDILDDNLKEIAKIRVENPDLSLREMGDLLKNPLSKSGVNHRLIKIEKIAERLREEKNANKNDNYPK